MMLKALSLLVLAALAAAKNPKVVSPQAMTYTAGEVMEIQWTGAETGYVNIDVVAGDAKVLAFPMMIASGVPSQDGKYSWKVPSEMKSAANYQLRVWGSNQPANTDDGMSPKFTILNTLPNAINTFTVVSPNQKNPCAAGKTCQITWDFPSNGMYPAMVDIGLYRVGSPNAILNIATVSSTMKSYSWAVPNDPALMSGDVYVSVSGQGMPMVGPGMSNEMGGNSQAFSVGAYEAPPSAAGEGKSEGMGKKESPKKESPKKEAPKKEAPKANPKITGAAKKDKNDATDLSTSVSALSVVLAMTLLTMYL